MQTFGYILTEDAERIPEGWRCHPVGEQLLGYGSGLFLSPGSERVVLSVLAQTEGELPFGGYVVFENGSLHLDACGMLPAVYAPARRVVASCPSLIPDEPYDPDRMARPLARDMFFPLGLTAKPGVIRLLPNHALDLRSLAPRRTWFIEALAPGDPDMLVDRMIDVLRGNLARARTHDRLRLALTAGHDSRALAACAGKAVSYTNWIDDAAEWDAQVARAIARDLGFRHEVYPFDPPTSRERRVWMDGVGYSLGGRVSHGFKTIRPEPGIVVTGLCGEVGRCFYQAAPITPEGLVQAMLLEPRPEYVDAAARWLEPLRDLEPRQILDLLYIEARLGCWAGPQMASPGLVRYAPFSDRQVVDLQLRVPEHLRAADWVPKEIVRRTRPELARHPHKPGRGLLTRVRCRATREVRKMRQAALGGAESSERRTTARP